MTCIIGFLDKKNKNVWIGGDSLGSNGYTKSVNLAHKVFRNSNFNDIIMGCTTSFRHIDLLKYSDNLFPEIDKYKNPNMDHKYMINTFIPNIVKLFNSNIFHTTDKGANFLIGCKDKLFEIQSDYSVLIPTCFSAVGSGEDVAMGSLLTTTTLSECSNFTPQDHILAALRSATKHCCGVQGPYVLLNTTENKEYIYKN